MLLFTQFSLHLCFVWGQAKYSINRNTLIKKKAIRILHSAAYTNHTCPYFCRYKILKFIDFVSLENCIFVNKCFNDDAFTLYSNYFKLCTCSHSYCTRSVSNGLIFKRLYNTIRYIVRTTPG